ncbi:GNAT family N-acetyltransferase [Desulfoluna butyratoxydans]|uniref:Acyl-coa n-acyltransferase n=1 Tax=Desulfoluna butyratoxydans TaxID=231438 RepID=A0A4U8YJB4_9BACT|nr:GNAT family N-acetyltransferase [Desulfoluna butyratoxydans]VFQ43129.1 acyl-coa n-acyltransferase [Desulfoluna butyratoxydans]
MSYTIEEIRPEWDGAICEVIRKTGAEFGAVGEGFGPSDPEVSAMSRHYAPQDGSLYLVARVGGRVVGGCGVAPFQESRETCELRKLFLLPETRGLGAGRDLAERCLAFAEAEGYRRCYLDTLAAMTAAISLYEALGFEHLDAPLAGTIHGGCDVWMLKAFSG